MGRPTARELFPAGFEGPGEDVTYGWVSDPDSESGGSYGWMVRKASESHVMQVETLGGEGLSGEAPSAVAWVAALCWMRRGEYDLRIYEHRGWSLVGERWKLTPDGAPRSGRRTVRIAQTVGHLREEWGREQMAHARGQLEHLAEVWIRLALQGRRPATRPDEGLNGQRWLLGL